MNAACNAPTTLAVLRFITAYIDRNHIPPTVREIAAGCYLGLAAVDYHLGKLEAAGALTRERHTHRNIRLVR